MRIIPLPGIIYTRGAALPAPPTIRWSWTCTVADSQGTPIGEIEPYLESVIWRLNGVNECKFIMSADDAKSTETMLSVGNRMLIQFQAGLPNWGGIIEDPQGWPDGETIELAAYGPQTILESRRTGKDEVYTAQTAGEILRGLIMSANGNRDMGISLGTVWTGGDSHTVSYHHESLYDVVKEECCERLADADIEFIPSLTNGRIIFTMNYVQSRGTRRPEVALVEGRNIIAAEVVSQGPIVNRWYIIGGGTGWGDARPIGFAEDKASIAKYGLRESVETYNDITSQTMLDTIAANRLSITKGLRNRLALTAVDKRPGSFSSYHVGDTVRCILHTKGFDGYDSMVRVIAREYDPNQNICDLAVEEVS